MKTLRLSNSEMSTFRRCKRKWYVSHYLELAPPRDGEEPGSALWIGNLVHDSLAHYYDPAIKGDPVAFVDKTVESMVAKFPEDEFDIRKESDLPRVMVQGYLEWLTETGADQDLNIVGAERMVEVPLAEGVTMLSKLDAPVERESDGAKLALEHKTTGSLTSPLVGLKIDSQLLTEHLARFLDAVEKGATHEEAYDQCHGVLYNQLRKVKRTSSAKPPFYAREDVPHNIHELRNHWRHVMAIAREIQSVRARLDAGEDSQTVCYPTPMPDRCSWDCKLFKVCALFDDGSNVQGALEGLLVHKDPLERYSEAEVL